MFTLATVQAAGKTLACLEVDGRYFPLTGLGEFPGTVAALFEEFYPGSCFSGTIAAMSCDGFAPAEIIKGTFG